VVVCLEQGADLHMAQLMPLPLTVSCLSKIQIGFTFLVPAYPGYPGKEAVKWLLLLLLLIKGPEYDVFPDSSQHPMLRYPLQAQLFMTALNRYSSNVTTKMKQPSKQYVAPNLK